MLTGTVVRSSPMTLPSCRYGPGVGFGFEVDVLLAGGRQRGHVYDADRRDPHRRRDAGDGIHAGVGDLQRLDPSDPHTAQCDILIGQQATGFRQLHGDLVGRRERRHPQRADQQVGGRHDQSEHQSRHRQPRLPSVSRPHQADDGIGDGPDHRWRSWLLRRRREGAISIAPGMFGSGITGTCGEFGPRPTTRSCRRHRVYFNEPTSWFQL